MPVKVNMLANFIQLIQMKTELQLTFLKQNFPATMAGVGV